ncbi:MAG: dienelactone hydrolase, partial [bacterium]|nr:dienelactone hydrolase [bacterium]
MSSVLGTEGPVTRLWPGLDPGPYAVGYTIRHEYDSSRSFKLPGNADDAAPSPRPVQISIWYPAEPPADAVPVTIRDYLVTAATETDFAPPDAARELGEVAKVKALVVAGGARPKRFDRAIERTTPAFRDAPPHPGSFPLVLFAPGHGANSFQSHVVCEYLASHGYVVTASPSVGRDSREMTSDPEGLEAQVRDLEFLISRVRRHPHVDPERIGAMGYSWGGLSVPLLAMGNDQVDAVVVLEGS